MITINTLIFFGVTFLSTFSISCPILKEHTLLSPLSNFRWYSCIKNIC
jgi:hypothetical protein